MKYRVRISLDDENGLLLAEDCEFTTITELANRMFRVAGEAMYKVKKEAK